MNFPEDDPKLIVRLILFLYTKYFPEWGSCNSRREVYMAPITMWMCYILRLLHPFDTAFINSSDAEIYEQDCRESLATVALVHALAVKMDVPKLAMTAQQEYLKARIVLPHSKCVDSSEKDFLASIKIVYQTTLDTDRSLRDFALFAVQSRLAKLRKCISKDQEGDDEDIMFREMLSSTPEFAVELLTFNQHGKQFRKMLFMPEFAGASRTSGKSFGCDQCKRTSYGSYSCACGMQDRCGYIDCTNKLYWTPITCIFCVRDSMLRSARLEDLLLGEASMK